MYDVVIIGCGITGAAAAFELSKYALRVAVLEKENDVAAGATKANSAIIHGGYDPKPGTLMARLNVRGAALAKELCRRLDVPYEQNGAFVAAFSPEDEKTLAELMARGVANGVEGLEILTGDEARALEPSLSDDVTAVLNVPSSAICLPWEYCLALAETAVINGAELYLEHEVTAISQIDGGWRVATDKGDFDTRYVINAAGVFAEAVHNMVAPAPFRIKPTRGEYYLLDKNEGERVHHTVFQCPNEKGKGVLVTPTVHGNLLVGPNADAVDGQDTANTAAGLEFVRTLGAKSVPSVDIKSCIRTFAGVRANSNAGDFVIGEVAGAKGFFDAAGICSPGLSAAPAIAEYLAELLKNAGLSLTAKSDFKCERRHIRFNELSDGERAELLRRRPDYGRVICRCETVTEGEITDAIHGVIPPRSIDGVKRRAGAGLGRCQGGFCSPRVAELLERELGISPDAVLQDAAGSYMLVSETKAGERDV